MTTKKAERLNKNKTKQKKHDNDEDDDLDLFMFSRFVVNIRSNRMGTATNDQVIIGRRNNRVNDRKTAPHQCIV